MNFFSTKMLTVALLSLTALVAAKKGGRSNGDASREISTAGSGLADAVADADADAQVELSQEELYPEFHKTLSEQYPGTQWEAHKVQSGNFVKTLFRLTGIESEPHFKATKQPVLIVGGGVSNVLSMFNNKTAKALKGKSKLDIMLEWEDEVVVAHQDGEELIPYLLAMLHSESAEAYEGFKTRAADTYGLDLDEIRSLYTEGGDEEAESCAR
jgi:hypothetical protein